MSNNDISQVANISDGSPLTYDTLTDMISTINALVRRVNSLDDANTDQSGFVNVVFDDGTSGNKTKIKIVSGSQQVGQKQIANEVTINYSNFSAPPKLIAMVREQNPNETNKTIYATIAITRITKNEASIKINFVKTPDTEITVDYIAIGPAA